MRRWIMDKAVVLGCFYGTNIQFQKSFRVFLTICFIAITMNDVHVHETRNQYSREEKNISNTMNIIKSALVKHTCCDLLLTN